jgi:hypothetical protein
VRKEGRISLWKVATIPRLLFRQEMEAVYGKEMQEVEE